MNLDQLIAFERIVREGSFSKAAWALQLSQPTVSARLKALEASVGGPLFKRNNRAVVLTERGSRFLPFARQALEAMQKGAEAAEESSETSSAALKIGVLHSMAGGFVSPALSQFTKKHPAATCIMKEGNHWQLIERLHDNQIELGLIAWPPIGPQLTELTPLIQFREQMVLLAHKAHPLAKLSKVMVEDVARLSNPFLLLTFWQVTPEPLTRLAESATHTLEVPTDTGRYLLAHGTGAGFFNAAQITPELFAKDVVEIDIIDMPKLYRYSALARLTRRSTLSGAAAQFTNCLADQAKKQGLLYSG